MSTGSNTFKSLEDAMFTMAQERIPDCTILTQILENRAEMKELNFESLEELLIRYARGYTKI